MIYETCDNCGANLDPGENCVCRTDGKDTKNKSDKLIVLRQLPVIEEHLHKIKDEITSKVETALSLVCAEDTVKTVKSARASAGTSNLPLTPLMSNLAMYIKNVCLMFLKTRTSS